jgi:N-methylhydantoinase B
MNQYVRRSFDPTTLEIYRALYTSVAEEMGIALRRTAFSPNIKERRDYSCAVFDSDGRVIAQGDHMPVHLGSMPMAVAAALHAIKLAPGETVALNDPFAGGTHLPDVTLVAGVYEQGSGVGGAGGGAKKKK